MGGRSPKALLPVGQHEPPLYYLLMGLEKARVRDLVVVTGHKPDDVAELVEKYWNSGEVTFSRNPRYASWGNFHTLRVAIDQSPGSDLLAVNSDIVIHPDVFRRVLDSEGDLVLAVQERYRLTDEDMRVQLRGRRVRAISKNLGHAQSHGEFCGVSLMRPSAALLYAEISSELEWRGQTAVYYEDVYARMLDGVDARAVEVGPQEYAEIDEPQDVAAAEAILERNAGAWESSRPAEQTP
jgi:choline kinase